MRILVLGATGATGNLLVASMLEAGHEVFAIVRGRSARLPRHERLVVLDGSVLEKADELQVAVRGVVTIGSCLGHRPTLTGIWGPPYGFMITAIKRVCAAVAANHAADAISADSTPPPLPRLVVMTTAGADNPAGDRTRGFWEGVLLRLIALLVPPHADSMAVMRYLYDGRDARAVEWAVVRPDMLRDGGVSEYKVDACTSSLFAGRHTRRANVAHFMGELMEGGDVWGAWRMKMPVITDADDT